MHLTFEQCNPIANELNRLAAELNLSGDQRQRLGVLMVEASERLEEYKQRNPHLSRESLVRARTDCRGSIRRRLVGLLTPEQLKKWDADVAAKAFLERKLAA